MKDEWEIFTEFFSEVCHENDNGLKLFKKIGLKNFLDSLFTKNSTQPLST